MGVKRAHDDAGGVVCISVRRKNGVVRNSFQARKGFYLAAAENIIGEYSFRLPKLGYFFQFLKTPMGYFTVVLIPFLLLIGLQIYRFIRLWRRYRWEQMAELRAQRMELEAERRRTQAMQEELERLRAKAGAGRRHES